VLAFVFMTVPPFQRRVPSHPQGYWLAETVPGKTGRGKLFAHLRAARLLVLRGG